MRHKLEGIQIPIDLACQITLATLRDDRDYLKKSLEEWKKNPRSEYNPNGIWMHPDDVINNHEIVDYLDHLIKYYGGEEF